jgi:hypothetical protein
VVVVVVVVVLLVWNSTAHLFLGIICSVWTVEPIALQYVAVTVNMCTTMLHFGSEVVRHAGIMLLFVLQLCV